MRPSLLCLLGIALLYCTNCHPDAPAEPPIGCVTHPNDLLQLVYPCDGQNNFLPKRFVWKEGPGAVGFQGMLEFYVRRKLAAGEKRGGLYSEYTWQTYDRAQRALEQADIALLPFTEYEWFMRLRDDGNSLLFTTPVRTFTTGETGYRLPTVFRTFAGEYTVQDTFYERALEHISRYQTRLVERAPQPRGTKTLRLTEIPNEIITAWGADTTTVMRLTIPDVTDVTVRVDQRGNFTWGDGNYYTPTSISGRVQGKSVRATRTRTGYNNGTWSSNRYTGSRTN